MIKLEEFIKEKSRVKLLCDLIEASIYYGGDAGGAYFSRYSEEDFLRALAEFTTNISVDLEEVLDELSKRIDEPIFTDPCVRERIIQYYKTEKIAR